LDGCTNAPIENDLLVSNSALLQTSSHSTQK
jgi:hypothetical protein